MPIKTILVHFNDSRRSAQLMRVAVPLARKHEAI